jgi:hypothetical protein
MVVLPVVNELLVGHVVLPDEQGNVFVHPVHTIRASEYKT